MTVQLSQEEKTANKHLFVIGSPRSGTTLLRNLLHGHPDIALTRHESHFVPRLLHTYGEVPALTGEGERDEFLRRFKRGTLYRTGLEREQFEPTDEELLAAVRANSWEIALRRLFDLYCDKDMERAEVWGDKTPTYVDHMPALDAALPDALYIHIIRDPRDQAQSERAIWGKSLRRSAATWRHRVDGARDSRAARAGRYTEVTYEALISDPETELTRLSGWLGLEFDPAMLGSAAGSDELGQMVGARAIDPAGVGARRSQLSARGTDTIAALAGDTARSLSYDLPTVPARELSRPELALLAVHDRAHMTAYFVRRRGLWRGLQFSYGALVDAGA